MKKLFLMFCLCICTCSALAGCSTKLEAPDAIDVSIELDLYYSHEFYDRSTQSLKAHTFNEGRHVTLVTTDEIEFLEQNVDQSKKTANIKCKISVRSDEHRYSADVFNRTDTWELVFEYKNKSWLLVQKTLLDSQYKLNTDITVDLCDYLLVTNNEDEYIGNYSLVEYLHLTTMDDRFTDVSVETDRDSKSARMIYKQKGSNDLKESIFAWTPEIGWSLVETKSAGSSAGNESNPIDRLETATLQYPAQSNTWKYNVYDCYIEITGYLGPKGADIVVPEEIDGLPVWKIGERALKNADIKSVQLPDCLERIGMFAFADSKIETIIMPQKLDAIGPSAFDGCKQLSTIKVPQGVVGIAKETFKGCESLSEIILPNSLTFIDEGAFRECTSLSNITVPESVTYIGACAFTKCISLHSFHVPTSVTEVKSWTFSDCINLSQVQLEEGIESIGEGAFSGCQSLESLVLPASVSSIGTNEWHMPPFEDVADNFNLTILNPDMTLYSYLFGQYRSQVENKVIHGYAGSTAAKYCASHGITFQLIE